MVKSCVLFREHAESIKRVVLIDFPRESPFQSVPMAGLEPARAC
jgi:hypothetical protein